MNSITTLLGDESSRYISFTKHHHTTLEFTKPLVTEDFAKLILAPITHFETAFQKCLLSHDCDVCNFNNVSYALFGGALRDCMVRGKMDTTSLENCTLFPSDYDVSLIFPDTVDAMCIVDVMYTLAEMVLPFVTHTDKNMEGEPGSIRVASQKGSDRCRVIVTGSKYSFDISYRFHSEVGLLDSEQLHSLPIGLSASCYLALSRVLSSSAGISAIAMTRQGTILVTPQFINDVENNTITCARRGKRHEKYCHKLQKRKFPEWSVALLPEM